MGGGLLDFKGLIRASREVYFRFEGWSFSQTHVETALRNAISPLSDVAYLDTSPSKRK